jgi:hypothetical protein
VYLNVLRVTYILLFIVCVCGPPLQSSGQNSRLQIHKSRVRFPALPDFLGLEPDLLSLVSTTEELLARKSSDSGLENRKYDRSDPLCWPSNTLYPQKLALTSPTSCSRSVDEVHSQTKPRSFLLCVYVCVRICSRLS